MSAKLYVKRGGGSALSTEVTDMTGRKGAPFFDGQQSTIDMGRRFASGEASQGTFLLVDPDAEIHSSTYRLVPHGLVTWTEDATGDELWLAKGRIAPLESGRRDVYIGGTEVEWNVTVNDNNIDTRGQAFKEAWVRPAETDVARLIALQAYVFDGPGSTAPRKRRSCTITVDTDDNGHLVNNTATYNMPAKTYPPGTQPDEIIGDCAERAGKDWGIVIHHVGGESHDCLLYCSPLDHDTYVSTVKISDEIADLDMADPDAPVFPPIWDRGKATLTENDDIISALVSIYGGTNDDPKTIFVEQPTDEDPYEFWTDSFFDAESENVTEATNRANAILESRRSPGHRTHRLSIKLHDAAQHALLNAGMMLQIKSAAAAGGENLGTYVWRRINELRWEPAPDGTYWAHIDLDRPLRHRPARKGSGQPAATTPKPPAPPTPGTPPVACTEIASYNWAYDSDTNSTGDGVFSWADNWSAGGSGAYAGDFTGGYGYNGLSYDNVFETSKHVINPGEQVELTLDGNNRGSSDLSARRYIVYWWDGFGPTAGGLGTSTIITLDAVDAANTYTGTVTAPASTGGFSVRMPRQVGHDNVTLRVLDCSMATPGTDPIPSPDGIPGTVAGTGDGAPSDSDIFIPWGSILEHDYITEGGPYHDADQIAIDDVGGIYTATEVEGALQEMPDIIDAAIAAAGPVPAGFHGVLVQRTTDFNTTNTNDSNPDFDTIHYDPDGLWDVGSPKIITIPADWDGKFIRVFMRAGWTGFSGGYVEMKLYKNVAPGSIGAGNDASLVPGGVTQHAPNTSNAFQELTSAPIQVFEGDFFTPTFRTPTSQTAIQYHSTSILFGAYMVEPGDGPEGPEGPPGDSPVFGTPNLTFGTSNTAGATDEVIRRDAGLAIFDATVPVTQAFSDAAATGSAAFAARRDHKHGMPAGSSGETLGQILISDTPSTPLVFADLIQNEAQDDLVYADP